MQAETRQPLHELARFCVVGLGSVIVNNLFIVGCTELLGIHYLISITLAFVLATVMGFALNRQWSFQKDGVFQTREIVRYFIVTLIGISLSLLATWYLMQHGIPYYITMIGIASLMAPLNFVAHRIWSFELRFDFAGKERAR